jgi:putative flippase GtrA
MEKIKQILKKLINKETVTYLVFGVLTTVVNFVIFKLFDMTFEKAFTTDLTLLTNFIAWVGSVIFAYVTNKLFVFESKSWKANVIAKEIPSFIGARVFSLGVEELGLFVFITWLGFDSFVLEILPGFALGGKMLVKIALAVIVVVMNYVFSKFIIFKNKEK